MTAPWAVRMRQQFARLMRAAGRLSAAVWTVSSLLLVGCSGDGELDAALQGDWHQRIIVPPNSQGRCVDELLTLEDDGWRSKAVVHASSDCNQPYLAVVYEGEVAEAVPLDDSSWRLWVDELQVVAVANISAGEYEYLSEDQTEQLSAVLLPERHRQFKQMLSYRHDAAEGPTALQATVYPPVLELVGENYPHRQRKHQYQR